MSEHRERDGMAGLALEFLVLTAARSGEVKGAGWPEMDFDGKVWNVPGAFLYEQYRGARSKFWGRRWISSWLRPVYLSMRF